MCSALSPPSASCAPGAEQCLFRLWEKTLCKQQSVSVVTSPLKIASLYLFSYPLCFHHLLPPTLIAAMPELLLLPGCCRQELRQAGAEAAQECCCCRASLQVRLWPWPGCCSCPDRTHQSSQESVLSRGKHEISEHSLGCLRRRKAGEGGCQTSSPAVTPCSTGDTPFVSQCLAGGFSLALPAEPGLDSS